MHRETTQHLRVHINNYRFCARKRKSEQSFQAKKNRSWLIHYSIYEYLIAYWVVAIPKIEKINIAAYMVITTKWLLMWNVRMFKVATLIGLYIFQITSFANCCCPFCSRDLFRPYIRKVFGLLYFAVRVAEHSNRTRICALGSDKHMRRNDFMYCQMCIIGLRMIMKYFVCFQCKIELAYRQYMCA